MNEVDCVYIIGHPEYEKDRIQYVISKLKDFGCKNIKICCPTWGNTLETSTCISTYDPYLQRGYPCINFKNRWLLKGEISLVLNFYNAISDAATNKYKIILVLESDVRFRTDFKERFDSIIRLSKEHNWSYISLSDGVGTHSGGFGPTYGEQKLMPPDENQKYCPFRCTDSMLFTLPFLQHLQKYLIPFRDCLDWELNYRILEFNGLPLWAEPHLIEQATQKRMSQSSLKV
jgi:hypothetical protein